VAKAAKKESTNRAVKKKPAFSVEHQRVSVDALQRRLLEQSIEIREDSEESLCRSLSSHLTKLRRR
jgi:hypothetical protein